ncbi:MAG: D-Ala-D-Ala carboxypeptidase family metallohydrolase [Pseudomonadota bacterium]
MRSGYFAVQRPPQGWRWPNFSRAEIACKGSGVAIIHEPSMDALQALRQAWGRPMILRSAYRSPMHNTNVGGAPNSMHLLAQAFDVDMAPADFTEFVSLARSHGFNGIGLYPGWAFVHIDTRETAAQWEKG